MFAYAGDLPLISKLDDYAPNAITRVYASNGETLGEFAIERRLVISYDEISPHLRNAIISAEDKDFNNHFGLSVSAMLVRLSSDLLRRRMVAGASTLTMQLARNLFADEVGFTLGDKSPERKIKEILVAIQIEKRYTKREILTLYCNQMIFGHGTYGVEAAARLYFGKRAKDVTLEEAAMIAGIIQTPARQSPYVNRAAAKFRRDYTLQQMADNGYITQEQADASKKSRSSRAASRSRFDRWRRSSRRRSVSIWSRNTARRRFTKAGSPCRRASTSACSGPRTARSTAGCASSTSAAATAATSRTSSHRARTSRRSATSDGRSPSRRTTSSRPSS